MQIQGPARHIKKRENNQSILGVVLLLGAALFFVFLAVMPDKKPKRNLASGENSAYSQKTENRVNDHLFITSKKIELEQQQAALKNEFYAPTVGDSVWPKQGDKFKDYGVDHSPDANESAAYQDLNRDSKELNYESPNAVIQGQLYDQQKGAQYEHEYKKEYTRQFVENARRNGYAVTVNENFVVTKVAPIRRPSQESSKIFNSSGEGAR